MKQMLLLAALVAAVVAAVARGAGPVVHWATGSGHTTFVAESRTFAFTAREYADGTDDGQAQIVNRDLPAKSHIRIDCLRVVGNLAHMSGTITKSDNPAFPAGSRC